ncbi:phosphotransferase enzyme family protein [Mangrovihabitans endophyticus]|uniref:Trifolitoxin immunity domain-containing protein n=1 Tax=Mangrovihabitans endophyticus TaxID=1751298 RepID=A0A8J3BXF1_9ACTN|nr:phosphotransferase [Mangrovihabitans endophyticus]GGK79404.1 trifolitoxin immunity domain-containing protein [Mangrovihabitans endophyticus]
MPDEALAGGRFAAPIRDGDTVTRLTGPGARNIHALLEHIASQGFDRAPRPLDLAADDGRETLTYLRGSSASPPLADAVRSEKALRSAARTVRALHDATIGFTPPHPGQWSQQEVTVPAEIDCIGHGDLAPWNLLFDDDQVVGVIDFDFAGPSNRAWDLAYLAHQLVPFHPTEDLGGFGWSSEPDRARRLRIFTTSYDLGMDPARLIDYAAIRLLGMATDIDQRVRASDPAYAQHGEHDFAAEYRRAAAFILGRRASLLTPSSPPRRRPERK